MSYYGGTITTQGRDLITNLIAGETIEFTRIVVGSGEMPEGVEPIDMTDLVNPVAEAASTVPVVEDGVLSMVVEYRNDMNGGLKQGFWLREFGIYAKTERVPEICLYYATLGDSPQPVNAYQDNRIDIRRYPITIALLVDADVQVEYNPGAFITAQEAQEIIESLVDESLDGAVSGAVEEAIGSALADVSKAIMADITIPHTGWEWQQAEEDPGAFEMDEYRYFVDVTLEDAKADHFPIISLHKESLQSAKRAKLCPTVNAIDGALRFWSQNVPEEDMGASVVLISSGTAGGEGGGTYVMPIATKDRLGGVKIGPNINVEADGTISVTPGVIDAEDLATSDETDDMLDEIFTPEDGE